MIYKLVWAWSTACSCWYLISSYLNSILGWVSLMFKIYHIYFSTYYPMLTESNGATSTVVNKINQGLFSGCDAKCCSTVYDHICSAFFFFQKNRVATTELPLEMTTHGSDPWILPHSVRESQNQSVEHVKISGIALCQCTSLVY